MFCEGRLSMDCARVKELPSECCPPLVAQRQALHPSNKIVSRSTAGIKSRQQYENTCGYKVLRLDSF
jgi:hypothetical protein